MSGHGKLTLRPRSHLDFVLGWPGIPGSNNTSRSPAHVAGHVEVRMSGKGVRAKWLRIELRKIETVPGGESHGELIGTGPTDVWTAANSTTPGGEREGDVDGSVWEVVKSQDYPFRIPLPEALPPTARLDKQIGIAYEVVASLCIKTTKGFIKKEDVSSVIQSTQSITLDKHELHSTWPAYNQPDTHTGERDGLRAKVRRERYAFAPGDKVRVKIIVSSSRVEPAKLKSVAVTIKETVTFHGVKPSRKSLSSASGAKPSMQRVDIVAQKAKNVGKKMYKGESKDFDLELLVPKNHSLMSISTAKHIEVSYTMRVYVDISKAPIIIDHIPMMMTTFPRSYSLGIMKKIGFVEGLSEREMLIDDDYDDDASTQHGVSRSVRPADARPVHQRSISYDAGSSSAGTLRRESYGSTLLGRRDTVRTQSTMGPGMAGRGVPGQMYNFGPGYPPGTQFGAGFDAPRLAFAGPAGNGQELSNAERAAMSHHSADPERARDVGMNYDDYGEFDNYSPRANRTPAIREDDEGDGFGGANPLFSNYASQPPSRPQTANQAAEMEKERLYQRAQQQAERNQRRAAHAQANPAGTSSSSQLYAMKHRSLGPSGTMDSNQISEEEKIRLWERARREAEAYQRGYDEGASFPDDEPLPAPRRPMSVQPQSRQSSNERFWLDNSGTMAVAAGSSSNAQQRPRGLPASMSYSTAEEEKKRLCDQARAQTEAHLMARRTSATGSEAESAASHMSGASSAAGPSVFAGVRTSTGSATGVGEKEQMRRYYEAQDQVQRHQARTSGASGSGAAGASGSRSTATPTQGTVLKTGQPSASNEKDQLARYYAAQDEVQKYQNQRFSMIGPSSEDHGDSSPPPPSFEDSQRSAAEASSSNATSSSVHNQEGSAPVSEKEQMRRYHEARDREALISIGSSAAFSNGTGSNSTSSDDDVARGGASGSGSAGPQRNTFMAAPRATYAPNFHSIATAVSSGGGSGASPSGVSVPAPSSASSASTVQPRGMPGAMATPPPKLALDGLSLDPAQGAGTSRRETSDFNSGPWAPKVAKGVWDGDDDAVATYDEELRAKRGSRQAQASGSSSGGLPPPRPPKTPLSSIRR